MPEHYDPDAVEALIEAAKFLDVELPLSFASDDESDFHRAVFELRAALDAIAASASRLAAVTAENTRLREALAGAIEDIDGLMRESTGVYGLHLNGHPAPWDEIDDGGRFEGWLTKFNSARALLKETPNA